VVGVGPKDQQVTFNPLELFHFSRTLVSSIYGNSDARRDIADLVEHVGAGRLDLASTITDRIGLADIPAAFERMQRGEGGRACRAEAGAADPAGLERAAICVLEARRT